MSFQISCPCGQILTVAPTMVGQPIKCPSCGTVLAVPSPREPAMADTRELDLDASAPPLARPRGDNFIAEELEHEAKKRPATEVEKRAPIDPTPLLVTVGGTILLM